MTRIYTNVPSMIARTNLTKNMSALQTSLERLSTGFKINSGKDDPAGLIASEMLRSDITGIKAAIKNTERANMMIATADSALNEVTNLLNDIRGLVTEAASTATMSAEMIKANQLQVDASLDAIDRIAAQTTFMGKKLLDGSLDFNLTGLNRNDIQGLSVNQATLSNDGPTQVTINVRDAAQKAALYYNQPALAESMVINWGGSYGYDMQTFEKGATVEQIAKIINERSDGTGVVAEVGSDALKGMLYVSSLGNDNDIIIDAGLAGINGGNVEIKYLRGSSEGIQIKYEEPTYEGAPAKILVYLQTEAYDAAFADHIDTSYTVDSKGNLVPLRDNNALLFESEIEGTQYNGANIYYVDGSLTDPNFYTANNPTGTSGMPYTYYSDTAKSSSALFGYVPGADPVMGVNNTALAFNGLAAGEYFTVQSKAGGSEYNNTTIQFVAANPSDTTLNNRKAAAVYGEQKDVNGNTTNKTLTIYFNNDGNTTLQDIQEALSFERHMGDDGVSDIGSFELKTSIGTKSLTDVTMANSPAGQVFTSNTHNSGGEAGSLFIVLPPDGQMPKSRDIPEEPGVTAKAVGDGLYLAHKDAAWDGYTFEFVHNPTVGTDGVTATFDVNAKKVLVVANGKVDYQTILNELNGPTRPPELANAGELYWANANGEATTPGVPKSLANTTTGGVVGRSTAPLVTLNGSEALYLHHNNADLNRYSIEFVSVTNPSDKPFVSVSASGQNLTVTYNAHTSYEDILAALNTGTWSGAPSSMTTGTPPAQFSWIKADGTEFSGTPYHSSSAVGTIGGTNPVYLSNNAAFNGYTIVFNPTGTGDAVATTDAATRTITLTYQPTANSTDLLDELNSSLGGSFNWVDANGNPSNAPDDLTTLTNVQLGTVQASGTYVTTSKTLPVVNSGTMDVHSTVPMGDTFYLAHDNPEWDNFKFNFVQSGTTGGSAAVVFDDANKTLTITVDSDTKYDTILSAINNTDGWTLTNPNDAVTSTYENVPDVAANGGMWFVDTNGTTRTPGLPSSLISSTTIGSFVPEQYSADGRSTLVGTMADGTGMYLQHTDKSWDNLDIKFTTAAATTSSPPITVNFDGETVNVVINSDSVPPVSYDDILKALNNPAGDSTAVPPIAAWVRPNGAAIPTNQLPKTGDLQWVGANGMITNVTKSVAGTATSSDAAISGYLAALGIDHLDPAWDDLTISFDPQASMNPPDAISVSRTGNSLVVSYGTGANKTYEDLLNALNGNWTGKPVGMKDLTWNPLATTELATALPTAATTNAISLGKVTYNTNGLVPSPPLNHVVTSGAVVRDITANDIAAMFDLENDMSRGSERAASMFNVTSTVDNDGTGLIRLYDYWIDSTGKPVAEGTAGASRVYAKTAFENAFSGGVTGGQVITTAAELVTALNNSAYWSMTMCPDLIAELAAENAQDKYYDASNPPVITARLAPGNHGLFAVSTFEEVAYYGDPNEGNALQFLGDKNSPNIRFVVDGVNSELSIDRTTVPAEEGQAQAVLTAQDSGASLTITATKKGEAYDDVQFVFKRISEDALARLDPDRRDGWVEYDPNTSFAEAQATFKDATTNQTVVDTAFYVTANERGDLYNNVSVMMRLDDAYTGVDPVSVVFDTSTNQLRVSIDSTKAATITTNDVIAAINKSEAGFTAQLSFSEDPLNDGTGLLSNVGLSSAQYLQVGNTGETGGHKGGTVTVWLADENPGPGGEGGYVNPTQEDIVRLINADEVVGKMFTAKAYNTVQGTDGKQIDFVKDGPIVSKGGLIEKALITVHLGTDQVGNVTTTAKDLETWWNTLDPALVDNISASIVRPQGAVWDDCNDPYGNGILAPTIALGECDELIINDIQFVGWSDTVEQQQYVAKNSSGVMTSQRGINSSYQLIARNVGPEWDKFTIEYVNDDSLTGRFADNLVSGASTNPCDDPNYSGLERDDCGMLITPNSTTEKGMSMVYDETAKKITINVKFGVTTANDIEQLIEADPRTRSKFEILQLGNGTGVVDPEDNTLLTQGGAAPPGELNGAKLLFGSDATAYYLELKSTEYGSDQFVHMYASGLDGGATSFTVTDQAGNITEKVTGTDADVVVNGISASASGLDVSLNTSTLSLDFSLSEGAGTTAGYTTSFAINGGGATFQVGPDVVTRQQISMGIRSINTVQLGGVSGVLNELRSGHSANLNDKEGGDTNKAFRIVEESLTAITSIRGRLGTMQRATLETNINVLNDTLDAITEAESQIRDTDFAEETANMTRAQILVQANMNTLSIANQIPNYMLSLLGG